MMSANEGAVTVYIDGASRGNPGHSALALVIARGDEILVEKGAYLGITTNNVAEYSALIEALVELRRLGVNNVEIRSDSELLVKQIRGEYKVKAEHLRPLYINARRLLNEIDNACIIHVPREQNKRADKIANKVLDEAQERSVRTPSSSSYI